MKSRKRSATEVPIVPTRRQRSIALRRLWVKGGACRDHSEAAWSRLRLEMQAPLSWSAVASVLPIIVPHGQAIEQFPAMYPSWKKPIHHGHESGVVSRLDQVRQLVH